MPRNSTRTRTPPLSERSDSSHVPRHIATRSASAKLLHEAPLGPRADISSRREQKSVYYQFKGELNDSFRPRYGQRSPSRSDSYRPTYSGSQKYHDKTELKSDMSDRKDGFDFHLHTNPEVDFRDSERLSRNDNRHKKNKVDKIRHSNNKNSSRAPGGYSGRYSRVAADREFLRTNRAPTPQLMSGMEVESGITAKFLPIEDLSDSEEADMDLSDNAESGVDLSGNEDIDSGNKRPRTTLNLDKESHPIGSLTEGPSSTNQDEVEGNKSAQKLTFSPSGRNDEKEKSSPVSIEKEHDSMPRWSNPDPYTALPPPDESSRKKKDVVKLIRKARINPKSSAKPEAPTDDFISFNFEENIAVGSSKDQNASSPTSMYKNDINDNDSLHKSERSRDSKKVTNSPRSSDFRPFSLDSKRSSTRQDQSATIKNNCLQIDLTSDLNPGSRKRIAIDELSDPPIFYEKGVRPPPDGRILQNWLPLDEISQSPWLADHSSVDDMESL